MARITLPNGWRPRDYQMPLWSYLEKGGKRAIEIAHRRWGKDDLILHRTAVAMFERPASYWHMLPEFAQARRALWTAVNPHTGKRRIDEAFPAELRENMNEQEMFIRFKNGATWQLVGSDRYNNLVGAGVAGVTFSEWALANPSSWGYIRPMIEENDGWATFITTPRGRNHAHAMLEMAKANPRWFAEVSNIHETGALTPEQLDESLSEYIALYGEDIGRAQFEQEYECSFNAAILGAFYAREMVQVRREGRIDGGLEAIEGSPVHRAWDIGVKDDTSIWWFQVVGTQIYILDCYSQSGAGVDHYAEIVQQRKDEHGWVDGIDFVPHDARVKEWGTGRTRVETMQGLGLNPRVIPLAGKLDGINAVRKTLPRCVFHARTEAQGISALEQYRREWDDDKKAFRASEVHDWCFTGDTMILTRHGMQRIMDLPTTGEVLSPCGWKHYENPRVTRKDAPLVEVRFADGLTVRCTPDHMFMTESGWKSAESLEMGSVIQSSWTLSRSISMVASIAYGQAKRILHGAAESFTGTFGEMLTGKSPEVATSTIGIQPLSTTNYRTLNASTHERTWQKHGTIESLVGRSSPSLTKPKKRLLSGIGQKKAGCGTRGMQSGQKAGSNGSVSRVHALFAGLSSIVLSAPTVISKSIAALTAKPLIIAGVKPLDYNEDVWCLTVPGVEAFALSNGATVHNCSHLSDAFRYLSMAWTEAPREIEKTEPYVAHTLGDIRAPVLSYGGRR